MKNFALLGVVFHVRSNSNVHGIFTKTKMNKFDKKEKRYEFIVLLFLVAFSKI